MRKVPGATVLLSMAILGCLLGVNLDQKVKAKQIEAFGEYPLGMPLLLFVSLLELILFMPVPFIVSQAVNIAAQAKIDRRRFSLLYVLTVGRMHPKLLHSQVFFLLGVAYFVALCAVWILYAESKGI
jgi:hypothetical protein